MTVDEFIDRLDACDIGSPYDPVARQQVMRWVDETGLPLGQLLDAVALRVASGFAVREFDFKSCQGVIDYLLDLDIAQCSRFFWDVYIAFDAGEASGWKDAVEKNVRPMIEALLDRYERHHGGTEP